MIRAKWPQNAHEYGRKKHRTDKTHVREKISSCYFDVYGITSLCTTVKSGHKFFFFFFIFMICYRLLLPTSVTRVHQRSGKRTRFIMVKTVTVLPINNRSIGITTSLCVKVIRGTVDHRKSFIRTASLSRHYYTFNRRSSSTRFFVCRAGVRLVTR